MLTIGKKKFRSKELEAYVRGKWFKQWSGIENAKEIRRRLKIIANSHDKRDFGASSGKKEPVLGFRLELIVGTKNHYSIRTGSGQWRIFFIWEKNEAWEIDLNKHDYKQVRQRK